MSFLDATGWTEAVLINLPFTTGRRGGLQWDTDVPGLAADLSCGAWRAQGAGSRCAVGRAGRHRQRGSAAVPQGRDQPEDGAMGTVTGCAC